MYNILLPTGVSYYPPDRNIEHPWHQSTNGHGTVMANMISRINPYTCLEVMRIEDGIDYMPGGGIPDHICSECRQCYRGRCPSKG